MSIYDYECVSFFNSQDYEKKEKVLVRSRVSIEKDKFIGSVDVVLSYLAGFKERITKNNGSDIKIEEIPDYFGSSDWYISYTRIEDDNEFNARMNILQEKEKQELKYQQKTEEDELKNLKKLAKKHKYTLVKRK